MTDPSDRGVRVRFAPSPTGFLHIGGLRTALYNYLFARQNRGDFILRIEDTDRERFVQEAERDILDSLRWAGLDFDEGPGRGGPHETYYQSQRADLYLRYANQLISDGQAYYAFDSVAEIDSMKERLHRSGSSTQQYDASTRMTMKNSLTMAEVEVKRRLEAGEPHVIRMKIPQGETVRFEDHIRGWVAFSSDELDDQVLIKSDGLPTYHLANVVDDHLMGITHVIRGEEWLPSTPKHVMLYKFFGWNPPEMAHLPLILSPTGGKLSKRNADETGIPVSVRQYRDAGYEPSALLNFLAFLGWNPGDEREIFTLDELVQAFRLERVGSSGVQFNLEKLRWYNEQHIRMLNPEEVLQRLQPVLTDHGINTSDAYVLAVIELMQERVTFITEIISSGLYFFRDPDAYDQKTVEKRWKEDSSDLLLAYSDRLDRIEEQLSAERAEITLRELAEERNEKAGTLIHTTRLAISGVGFGPSLFHMMEVIGRDACVRRLRRAAERLA